MSCPHAHDTKSRVPGSSGNDRYAESECAFRSLARSTRCWVMAAEAFSRSVEVRIRRRSRIWARKARFSDSAASGTTRV